MPSFDPLRIRMTQIAIVSNFNSTKNCGQLGVKNGDKFMVQFDNKEFNSLENGFYRITGIVLF